MSDHPSLELLRVAFRGAGPEVELPAAEDLEKLRRAVEGELPRRELLVLVDRTTSEPGLALAWRLAITLRRELGPPAEAVRRPLLNPRTVLTGLALAASIVLAVWIGPPSNGVKRGRSRPAVSTSLADGATLPRDRFELRWAATVAGARYDVDVLDEDLQVIYRVQGIRATRLTVPRRALAGVPSGGTVLWRVEARTPGGGTILSPTFVQRLE